MDRELLKSKFLGALIGTGVGDALGAPFEGWPWVRREDIEAVAEMRQVLIYTDDTHMMLGIAESLIRVKGFDGEDMAGCFVRNYQLEPYRGYGPGPPRIFRVIREGEAWDKAADRLYRGGSFGNGAAMRIAPVGVLYYDDPEELKEVACKSSQITHAHALGKEGGALQAGAIALATGLKPSVPLDRADFLTRLEAFIQADAFKQKLASMGELLFESKSDRVVAELGHGIEAFNSVPAAIYSFLAHSHSYAEAVTYAISLGGDTDTIGAMTGAISGAYLGVEVIPAQWRNKLENGAYIEELAEKLWALKC